MGLLRFRADLVRLMNSSRSSPGRNLDCIPSLLACLMWLVISSLYWLLYGMPLKKASFRRFTCHCSCAKTTLVFCWIALLTTVFRTLLLNGPKFRRNVREREYTYQTHYLGMFLGREDEGRRPL